MKQVENVSINGIVFTLNNDACAKLENYLDKLGKHFEYKQEGSEIIADIEARIAELFGERRNGINRVINLDDVMHVIAQLGSVEAITNSDDEEGEQHTAPPESRKKYPKRLYRNPTNRRLGGVCSGIAVWLNIDPIAVRLLFVLIFVAIWLSESKLYYSDHFIPVMSLFIYPLLWFIIPMAKTAAQKLEMLGQSVSDIAREQNSIPLDGRKKHSKRLYRNPNQRRLGGVCSGIAVWLNIDPVAVRLLTVISCLFFWYIHDHLYHSNAFVPVLAGFIYLVFWFIIPMAKTTAQKLAMYGQAVNINNIEKSIIDQSFEKTSESNGVVAEILGNIVRIIVGAILFTAGLGMLFGTIYCVFILDFSSSFFNPDMILHWQSPLDFVTMLEYSQHMFPPVSYWISICSLTLVLGLSMAACLYWGVHFIMGLNRKPSKIHAILIIIWLAAIIVMVTAILSTTQKYYSYKDIRTVNVLPATDTLYLSSHSHVSVPPMITGIFYDEKEKRYYGKPVLYIRESADKNIKLEIIKKSSGKNPFDALRSAESTEYTVDISENPLTLSFPACFSTAPYVAYKVQQVRIVLYVPKNTFIKKDELFDKEIFDIIW